MPSNSTEVARIGKSKYALNNGPVFRGAAKIREKWEINWTRLNRYEFEEYVFWDGTPCIPVKVPDVSKQPNALHPHGRGVD
jgi:hypothetical protein